MTGKLLLPAIKTLIRKVKPANRNELWRFTGVLFLAGAIFGLSLWSMVKLLTHFRSIEVIGELLTRKVLSIIYLSFFFVLIISNAITSFSTYFFSDDLTLIRSSPVKREDLYLSRFLYTLIMSSYLVMFFFLPVVFSYGYVYRTGPLYYLISIPSFFIFLLIPCALGSSLSFVLVAVFPARRVRDFIFIVAMLSGLAVYVLIRVLQPERLVDPEKFRDLANYISSLSMPEKLYLPSYWLTRITLDSMDGVMNPRFFLLLLSGAFSLSYLSMLLYLLTDEAAWSKAQEARGAPITGSAAFNRILDLLIRPFGRTFRAFMIKDAKIFFRDTAQWSQIFLLSALIAVYLYNYYVLPLDRLPFPTIYVHNFIAFVNMGLAGFVIAAVATRFVYSAISLEGDSIWVIKSAPVSPRAFLMSKGMIGFLPLFLLAEILTVATNFLLHTTTFIMMSSVLHIAVMVLGLVSMGIGIGALYPNFKYENVAQIPMGYGGFIYMVTALAYVALSVVLSAVPIYTFFQITVHLTVPISRILLSILFLFLLIFLHFFVITYFFKTGERAFRGLEI